MESFSWVSEGPSPLKETQTVKKKYFWRWSSPGSPPVDLRRSSGYLLIFSFWRKWALGAPTNRFPLVEKNPPTESGWKRRSKKNALVPVFRAEMLVTQYVLSSSRHLVTPLIYIHFCIWLGLFVDRWWLKEVWYAPDFFVKLLYLCARCCSRNNRKPK